MTFILAVDVGNTRAKYGVFESDASAPSRPLGDLLPKPLAISATPLVSGTSLSENLGEWLDANAFGKIERCIVAGSNPPQRDRLTNDWRVKDSSPTVIDHFSQVPIHIDVDQPESVGIDRLLTAFAARHLITTSQPIIVVDSGTATTVNLTTSDGTFRGGAILPGLRLSAHAMHDYTARLPLINSDTFIDDETTDVSIPVLGRNTDEAMKAGLFWGQLGAVREIAVRLEREAKQRFGEVKPAAIVLTGGGGRQLVSQLPTAVYIDGLALHGLAMMIAEQPPAAATTQK